MADEAKDTGLARGEEPLFSYTYELSNQLVEDAATALAGDPSRNPATMACAGSLVVIIAFASSPIGNNPPVLILLVIIEMALWSLARKWHEVQVWRLRRAGLDTALVAEDQRRRSVSVYDDRLVVEERNGHKTALPMDEMRRPKLSGEVLVLTFSRGRFVPVPRKSMSVSRFDELVDYVARRTNAKRLMRGAK